MTDELIGKKFANKNLNLSLYKSQFKIEKSKLAKQLIDSHTTSYKTGVDKKIIVAEFPYFLFAIKTIYFSDIP